MDHILVTTLMFYMAGLSLYMFCRHPNPPISQADDSNHQLYGVVPVKERGWVSPLLLLLPPVLAVLLCLPVPLMQMTHQMIALPGGLVCTSPEIDRAVEMLFGLILPATVYSVLPGYRKFCSQPDTSDLRRCKRDQYLTSDTAMDTMNTTDTLNHSQSSLDLELVTRGHYS